MISSRNIKATTYLGCTFIVATAMCLQAWGLNKGLILSDEGWFACLLKDHPKNLATQFQLLFGGLFGTRLLASRVLAFLLKLLGAVMLSLGAACFVKSEKEKVSSKAFGTALLFVFIGQIGLGPISLNYVTLSLIITEIALGLILLGIGNDFPIFLVFGGIVIWFIVPVKITASLVIPAIGVLAFLLSKNRKWRNVLFLLFGILIGATSFFSICISPEEYFSNFIHQASATIARGESDYGIVFMLNWLKAAFVFYFNLFLIFYFIFSIFSKVSNVHLFLNLDIKQNKTRLILYITISICTIAYLIWSGFFPLRGKTVLKPYIPFWILAFILIFQTKEIKNRIFPIFLLLIPLLLGFGSDSPVYAKPHYVPFVTLSIWYTIKRDKHFACFFLIAVICFYSLIQGELLKRDWFGNKWLDQTEDVRLLGVNQNIKLDKRNFDMLNEVLEITGPEEPVISDMFSWGLVYLAELSPVSHSFRMNTENAESILKSSIKERTTLNILMLYDTESDFGSKEQFLSNVSEMNDVDVFNIGYHRVLIRYSGEDLSK